MGELWFVPECRNLPISFAVVWYTLRVSFRAALLFLLKSHRWLKAPQSRAFSHGPIAVVVLGFFKHSPFLSATDTDTCTRLRIKCSSVEITQTTEDEGYVDFLSLPITKIPFCLHRAGIEPNNERESQCRFKRLELLPGIQSHPDLSFVVRYLKILHFSIWHLWSCWKLTVFHISSKYLWEMLCDVVRAITLDICL